MPTLPQRKSPRLQGYDYSQSGAYFVTICTYQRLHLFGSIDNEIMHLNTAGEIVAACWQTIPTHYPDVELDAFVVMPNHMHGILVLYGDNLAFRTMLGRVINAYKGAVTARFRQQATDSHIWQTRYHDHIIRSEANLNHIRNYVATNPARWAEDTFYGVE